MYCIETIGLVHKFSRDETALDSVGLRVPDGSIYGFLGPNGAGKTTTLKLVLGLLKKQQGEITVFGRRFDSDRIGILRRTGSTIESPSIYGHLTAAENLKILQRVYGCSASRIHEVLDLVGLAETGRKRAAQFSLGMKQRLSIAIALLHQPSLLILDEPTNGLDPNGILEIRELLRRLNEEHGITVLISSHLLSEIEKLVTHAGIIHRGRLLFQGTLDELMAERRQNSATVFETSDNARAAALLKELKTTLLAGALEFPALDREQVARITRRLVENGIDIYRIGATESDLEKIFFDVISE
jgi:ABC-type multidrug transport system ATPase subunit